MEEKRTAKGEYVYTGFKKLADWKIKLGEWLEDNADY